MTADPLTISLRGAMIREKKDLFSQNDLAIMTTFQFGKEPPVQKLHYMCKNVKCGWQGDFFNDIILSIRDFKDLDSGLALRTQIYDMDKFDKDLVEKICGIASSTATAFPYLAPYVGAASFGSKALLDVIHDLDKHDEIVDQRVKLEAVASGTGHHLLQPGYFICFREPIDAAAEDLSLDSELHVIKGDGKEFDRFSYAVVEVQREFKEQKDLEIDPKAATLIAELSGQGQSGKSALEFLRGTIDTYTKFRKLERVQELQAKTDLNDSEKALLEELKGDKELKAFMPKPA
ncbi:MAG: hypothetical protein GKC10_02760 [Methanosarcinales archaeon]|nr:hypothetical protein [Methanosarcinales archaeon]